MENKPDLIKADDLIKQTVFGEYIGLSSGFDSVADKLSWNMSDLVILASQFYEGFYLSKRFQDILGLKPEFARNLFGIKTEEKILYMLDITTPDESVKGSIPVMFGATDIFPLLHKQIIIDNQDTFNEAGIHTVSQGHQEWVINDLQNYSIPNRVYRHYKRSLQKLVAVSQVSENQLLENFLGEPQQNGETHNYWMLAVAHTAMHFNGFINPELLSDEDLTKHEDLFFGYHSMQKYVQYKLLLNSSILSPLYNLTMNGVSLGFADMNVVGDDWYWVNTSRIRLPSIRKGLDFNINDAILCALIEKAKIAGAKTFNLGFALPCYEYKSFYGAELVWQPGLRYADSL